MTQACESRTDAAAKLWHHRLVKTPAKSPGARRRTQLEQARSLRVWQRVSLNSRALALLLTRRNGAQRPRSDRHHRPLLLFSGQVLDQLAISFF